MNASSPLRVFCGHIGADGVEEVYEDTVGAWETSQRGSAESREATSDSPDVTKPNVEGQGETEETLVKTHSKGEVDGLQMVGEGCETSAIPQVLSQSAVVI